MGLDYSYMLFFKHTNRFEVLERLAELADCELEKQTTILFPDRIALLPFESWSETEKEIRYDDSSKWHFMTVLNFPCDDEIAEFTGRPSPSMPIIRLDHTVEDLRVPIGYIYLTVYPDLREAWGTKHEPGILLLEFTAATSKMSILFAVSSSIRNTLIGLLQACHGLYGLIDRENDAVVFWVNGEEYDKVIPGAYMPLIEIEAMLGI